MHVHFFMYEDSLIMCVGFDACLQETVLQGRKLAGPELQADSMYQAKSSVKIIVKSLLSTCSCFCKAWRPACLQFLVESISTYVKARPVTFNLMEVQIALAR